MATRKIKRFTTGGVTDDDLEAANASEDPIATLNKRKGWTDTEEETPTVTKKQSFKEAFAENRKAGNKTFEWEGKKYTTEMAGEKKATPKTEAAPKPAAKPAAKYETPYDRMNRENRETSQSRADTRAETERLAKRNPSPGRWKFDSSKVNPKTLLPLKKGGVVGSSASRRADGIATKGKTKGRML